MEEINFNITIVGLGLIGGSYAMALKELNPKNLWAVDIDENTIKAAQNMGIVDKGYLEPSIPLKNSDIVIICLYPGLTIEFIKENMKHFKKSAIITDTSGIKNKLIKEINPFIRDDIDFIGGHPMAGREYKGLAFATKDIFMGANYILTPTDKNKDENIKLIENIIKRIGCKNIVKVSPKKHDKMVAYTSQIPHAIAAALMNGAVNDDMHLFIAGSFKDGTRVARMNVLLWTELFMSNKESTLEQIEVFEKHVSDIKNTIINEDYDALENIFENARCKREEFIEKCMK